MLAYFGSEASYKLLAFAGRLLSWRAGSSLKDTVVVINSPTPSRSLSLINVGVRDLAS